MRIQIWQILLLIVAFILLFGWKNLPNVSRSLGESLRVFKSEVDQMKDENAARKEKDGEKGSDEVEDTAQEEYRRLNEGRGDDGAPRA